MTDDRLTARTRRLPSPPDLLAFAGNDGLLWRDEHGGLAGRGVAASIEVAALAAAPQVAAALAEIEVDDPMGLPGTGAVAIGALPFDPHSPGRLTVPSHIVGRRGDVGWETLISAGGGAAPSEEAPAGESPDEFQLVPSMPHSAWRQVIAEAVDAIAGGDLQKVVLARRIDITANRAFVIAEVLERLVALYPSCMVFSIDGFVGASPELLISRRGDAVETHPLAGTVARSGDAHGDQALVAKLMASPKARHEHQVVIDALVGALSPLCSSIDVPAEPSVMGLRNVSHLATHITGLLAGGPRPSALELVARVHPTPAVGGTPTDTAVKYLQSAEGFDRGCYAGPVGWVDSRGDGMWAIGIRSALVDGSRAQIYAGNGIVAGSEPADELAETQLKLQALLAALVRP